MDAREMMLDAIWWLEDAEDTFQQLELRGLLDDIASLKADAEIKLGEIEEEIKDERAEPQYDKEEM